MAQYASFLPGSWLLVPEALGRIGLTELAGDAGTQDLAATMVSILAVALGVLCRTLLLAGATATGLVGSRSPGRRRRGSWRRDQHGAGE